MQIRPMATKEGSQSLAGMPSTLRPTAHTATAGPKSSRTRASSVPTRSPRPPATFRVGCTTLLVVNTFFTLPSQ
eukprot:11693023-Karenia_brevis.AAC.1